MRRDNERAIFSNSYKGQRIVGSFDISRPDRNTTHIIIRFFEISTYNNKIAHIIRIFEIAT